MLTTKIRLALAGGLLLSGWSAALAVEVHTLRSGNGVPGGPDSQITFWQGPSDAEINVPLTAAQFLAAQGGPPAIIIPTGYLNGAWTPNLSADPLALWISDNAYGGYEGSTNLYAIPFTVSAGFVSSATLDFAFLCDNWLGEVWIPVNEGLYLNGVSLPGTSGGNYATETSWSGINVTSLVTPGLNFLYILSSDVGGPGGLDFSATVRINGDGTVAAHEAAAGFQLGEAYPNPFNPATTLSFTMAETGPARLEVFNLAGARVATLWDGMAERGAHVARFDAAALPSGLYLYRLSTEAGVETRKMILGK